MSQFDELCSKLVRLRMVTVEQILRAREPAKGSQRQLLATLSQQPAHWDTSSKPTPAVTPFQKMVLSENPGDKDYPPSLLIRDFLILDELGKGGMGAVYRAWNFTSSGVVALKIMRAIDAMSVRRSRNEYQIMRKLDGLPGVVRALDHFEDHGRSVLVMEYQNQGDLFRLINRYGTEGKTLAWRLAVRWTSLLLEGLAAAHERGYIHRDVKPHNVMIHKSIDRELVRLSDWGIVRVMDEATMQTKSDELLGTFEYMPPELWAGASGVTPASDLYSLGCTLFFALTGRPPFWWEPSRRPAHLMGALCHAHINTPMPNLVALRKDIPNGLVELLRVMMDKDPLKRSTAASLRDHFQSLLERPDASATIPIPAARVPAAFPSSAPPLPFPRPPAPSPVRSVVAPPTHKPQTPRDRERDDDRAVPLLRATGALLSALRTWSNSGRENDPLLGNVDERLATAWRVFRRSLITRLRANVFRFFAFAVLAFGAWAVYRYLWPLWKA